jgi:hypothetical protein
VEKRIADVVDLAARRQQSEAEVIADEAYARFQGILELIGTAADPTEASLSFLCGLARFLATRGVTADEIARLVERHVAEELRGDPDAG